MEKVERSYKAFVSSKVMEQIAASQGINSSGLKPVYQMKPIVISEDATNYEPSGG